jgi:hypothetical protein
METMKVANSIELLFALALAPMRQGEKILGKRGSGMLEEWVEDRRAFMLNCGYGAGNGKAY